MTAEANLVEEARKSRRSGLVALRDMLAEELSNRGHIAGCSCECGVAGDGRVLATLAKQFAAVMAELDALPGVPEGESSKVVSLTERAAEKRREAMGRDASAAV